MTGQLQPLASEPQLPSDSDTNSTMLLGTDDQYPPSSYFHVYPSQGFATDLDTSAAWMGPTGVDPSLLHNTSMDVPLNSSHHDASAGGTYAGSTSLFTDATHPSIMPAMINTVEAQTLIPYTTRAHTVYFEPRANALILRVSLGPSNSPVRVDVHVPTEDALVPVFSIEEAGANAAMLPGDHGPNLEYQPRAHDAVMDYNLNAHQVPDNGGGSGYGAPQAEGWLQYTNI